MAFPAATLDVGVLSKGAAAPLIPRSPSSASSSVGSPKDDPKDADWGGDAGGTTGCSFPMDGLDVQDEEEEKGGRGKRRACQQKGKKGAAVGRGRRKRAASPTQPTITIPSDSPPTKKSCVPVAAVTNRTGGMRVSGLLGKDSIGVWYAPQTHIFAYKSGDAELAAEVLKALRDAKREWDSVRGCECEIWHSHADTSVPPSVVAGMTSRYLRKTIPVGDDGDKDSRPAAKRGRGE
jgi:hypothetical protein